MTEGLTSRHVGAANALSETPPSNEPRRYQYQPLTGDDIRLVKLLPGRQPDALYAEIIHRHLPSPTTALEQTNLLEIQKTLKGSWTCGRTPEGRLVYFITPHDKNGNHLAQYDHPFANELPTDLRVTLKLDWIPPIHDNMIDEDEQYEALSYAWGDAAFERTLYLQNGTASGEYRCLPITANLYLALRHLRGEKGSRLLWVDAVFINQGDNAERSEQVARMAIIFRSAVRTIAWLGEASADSRLAIDTMQYLSRQIEIL